MLRSNGGKAFANCDAQELTTRWAAQPHGPFLPFQPPAGGRVDLLVIAGEHSGDGHAARVVRELRRRSPGLSVAALGGPALAGAGTQVLIDLTGSSVIGYVEVIRRYRSFFRPLFEETLRWIGEHRPRAVLFVGSGGLPICGLPMRCARGA